MLKRHLLLITTFLTIHPYAFANDTAFGGSGASPMPIKQTDVAMLSEDIVITGHDIARADMKGYWAYDCNYFFKNLSTETLSFQMGFPFPVNDELGETTVPAGFNRIKNQPLVYNFSVTMLGKKMPVSNLKMKATPEMNYEDAYIWPIKIAPNAEIKIHHSYLTGITVNSMGQYYVTFVLKTGGLWAGGTIGETKLTVIPNTPTKMCTELDKSADYAQAKPSDVQVIGDKKERKYYWDLKNFKPSEDLELCLISSKNYVRYFIVYPLTQGGGYNNVTINVNTLSAVDLRLLRNTIYAQYGRQFVDADLQSYFDKQWWYEKNANYSDQLLTSEDKKAIAIISQAEAKRK